MNLRGGPRRRAIAFTGLITPVSALMLLAAGPAARRVIVKPEGKVEERSAFYVVGLARRTNNARELAGVGEIAKVWQEFNQKQIGNQIASKLDDNLLAVYTDYESDQNGDYTYLLGKRVSDLRQVPTGLTGRYVPAGRYTLLVSEKGPLPQVVPKLWGHVWSMTRAALGGRRSFTADYELYDQRAKDPQDGQVELYLGID